jgi:hypothetical protein
MHFFRNENGKPKVSMMDGFILPYSSLTRKTPTKLKIESKWKVDAYRDYKMAVSRRG